MSARLDLAAEHVKRPDEAAAKAAPAYTVF
jgi:hypothetical protein